MADGMRVNVQISKRLRDLGNRPKFRKRMSDIFKFTALWLLGRSSENMNDKNAILRRGFGQWKGSGNKLTRFYPAYTDKYEEFKEDAGLNFFHTVTGDLANDAISNAEIKTNQNGFTITAKKGKSAKYQLVQDKGSRSYPAKGTPPRPIYSLDRKDIRRVAIIIEKRLIQAFGFEARTGNRPGR